LEELDRNIVFLEKRRKLTKIAENCDHSIGPRDRCYDLKNIFAEKFGENIGRFFAVYIYCKNWIVTMFFRRKLAKIAEISDHSVDPRLYVRKKLTI
jgi:hypothetical protein